MTARMEWRVSLERLPLPRYPIGNETRAERALFLPKRFKSEHDALAFAAPKIHAGYGLTIDGPNGERLGTPEIRQRLAG